VHYDHFTGNRFSHGAKFLRWRPDKSAGACLMAQVSYELRRPGLPFVADRTQRLSDCADRPLMIDSARLLVTLT
jgi:hypothetical protein